MRKSLLALCAVAALSACGKAPEAPPETAAFPPPCRLSVGWDPWEPYQYEDTDHSVRGLDIEIVSLLAQDAGCTLDFVRGNWLDLLAQLREGRIGILLAATVIADRQEYARFSQPYREESFALYVRGEDLAALSNQDLRALLAAGRKVGYTEGYCYGDEVGALISGSKTRNGFVSAPVVEANYSKLIEHGIDALLDDPFVAASVIRRKGWTGRISRHPQTIASGSVSLMFSRKGVPAAVVKRFDEALGARKADRSLEQLLARYQS